MGAPISFVWDGTAMKPLPYFKKQCELIFKPEYVYRLAEVEQRNMDSHRHFFACINEAHSNLREGQMQRWPTPDHLRKWALTFTPFCDVRHYHAETKAEALRVLKFLREANEYSRVEIHGPEITQYVPNSQALKAMPESRIFMASKRAVLEVLAKHLDVPLEELEKAGSRAA